MTPKRTKVRYTGGRKAPSPPKDLLRDLRFALGLTQQEAADRSSGLATRFVFADVETGGNKMTVRTTFRGVAKGLGVTEDELDDLIASRVSVADLAARVLEREPALREGAARSAALVKVQAKGAAGG